MKIRYCYENLFDRAQLEMWFEAHCARIETMETKIIDDALIMSF